MMSSTGDAGDEHEPESMASVLFWLQREWGRFERERAQWTQERSELQARVAFLEGQRRGEANLKMDLLRRIKMLEFALRQERAKNTGKEPDMTGLLSQPEEGPEQPKDTADSKSRGREGRVILMHHLAELGYTDSVIHAQAQRLKGMLDNWPPSSTVPQATMQMMSMPPELPPKERDLLREAAPPQPAFDEEEDEEEDGDTAPANDDFETDESAAIDDAFGGLLEELEGAEEVEEEGEFESIGQGQSHVVSSQPSKAGHITLTHLTEEESLAAEKNKKDLSGDDEGAAAAGGDDDDPFASVPDGQLQALISSKFGGAGAKMMKRQGKSKKGKKSKAVVSAHAPLHDIFGEAMAAEEPAPALGELADLSVSNDIEPKDKGSDSSTTSATHKSWKAKLTLRSHLDAVRAIDFHPTQSLLASASEDKTVKVWSVPMTWKRHAPTDLEPICTFRGHSKPVYAVAISADGGTCFSGSGDTSVRMWTMPSADANLYGAYSSPLVRTFVGHSDVVWSVATHPTNTQLVVSASADGTCRLWDTSMDKCKQVFENVAGEGAAPTSVEFLRSDPSKVVVAYTNAKAFVLDVATGNVVVELQSSADADGTQSTQINAIRSHHTLGLLATAHEDKQLKFYDASTGECTHSMVAHQEAVTSLDFDPNGLYTVTSGHDRSVRVWDVATKHCVDEVTTHRHKYDEAIHAIRFHPSLPYFASAGADATIRVFF